MLDPSQGPSREEAKRVFDGTEVNITTAGKEQLGTAVNTPQFKEKFVGEKWKNESVKSKFCQK